MLSELYSSFLGVIFFKEDNYPWGVQHRSPWLGLPSSRSNITGVRVSILPQPIPSTSPWSRLVNTWSLDFRPQGILLRGYLTKMLGDPLESESVFSIVTKERMRTWAIRKTHMIRFDKIFKRTKSNKKSMIIFWWNCGIKPKANQILHGVSLVHGR